jgi:hypothetical protein
MNRPIRSRADLAMWVDSCVLGDLRTLLVGVDAYQMASENYSRFSSAESPAISASFFARVHRFNWRSRVRAATRFRRM